MPIAPRPEAKDGAEQRPPQSSAAAPIVFPKMVTLVPASQPMVLVAAAGPAALVLPQAPQHPESVASISQLDAIDKASDGVNIDEIRDLVRF